MLESQNGRRMKVTPVEEVFYGVYVWQMPSGALVKDEQGNYLCIASMKGDIKQIKALRNAAKSYGLDEGKPMWLSGHRLVSNDEYEEQNENFEHQPLPEETRF